MKLHPLVCKRCNEAKPREAFGRWVQGLEQLHCYCRTCISAQNKKRYAANPEAYKEYARQWGAANPEKVREAARKSGKRYRTLNPEKAYASSRAWLKANPHKRKEYDVTKKASRRLAKKTVWDNELDSLVLAEAADLCKLRKAATGVEWQVDHVIPLKAKEACGLHNAYNLAVVPAEYNSRKKNRIVNQPGFVVERRP